MDVYFQSKSLDQNRLSIQVEGYGTIYFIKGSYSTSDKNLIKKLRRHPVFKRNGFYMVTDEELVAKYLAGETPDKFTREILDDITLEGILELADIYTTKSYKPELVKVELVGEFINDEGQKIIDFYKKRKSKEEEKADIIDAEERKESVQTIKSDVKKSGDMLAKEAIEYIENTPMEDLDGFISDDEERKTVLEAYNDKQ